MNVYEMTPNYDSRKSFYKKAHIIEQDDIRALQSYDTIVARYNTDTEALEVYGTYSPTTLRHIKEFINTHTTHRADTIGEVEEYIK